MLLNYIAKWLKVFCMQSVFSLNSITRHHWNIMKRCACMHACLCVPISIRTYNLLILRKTLLCFSLSKLNKTTWIPMAEKSMRRKQGTWYDTNGENYEIIISYLIPSISWYGSPGDQRRHPWPDHPHSN